MNYVLVWHELCFNYGLNQPDLVQIIMSGIMFIYGRQYGLLCFIMVEPLNTTGSPFPVPGWIGPPV